MDTPDIKSILETLGQLACGQVSSCQAVEHVSPDGVGECGEEPVELFGVDL